jgi:hypothetical protein
VDTFAPQPDSPQPVNPERTLGGVRRVIATVGLSAMLLVVGGAAVAFAASPDPSASPAPAATSDPGTTTAPGGTTAPNGTTTPKSTHDCPNMGGSGTGRGSGGTTPSLVTPTTPTTPSATPSV